MEKFTTGWKIVKRNLISNGYKYTNHGNIGEFNKTVGNDDIRFLINKEDPWNLSYVAYMGEEPISFHNILNHSIFFMGGLHGSVKKMPAEEAPITFSRTVYVYLGAAAHKGHGIPRSLARKEMGIE